MAFSEKLKRRRKELGMTQEEVAGKIFVSQKSISNWETCRTYPDVESLVRLVRLYDMSLDELFLEDGQLVKEMNIQAEVKMIKKLALPSLLINVVLILLLMMQSWWGELSLQAVGMIIFVMCANFVPMFYFRFQRLKIAKSVEGAKSPWLTVLILLVIVIIGAGIIIHIPQCFR